MMTTEQQLVLELCKFKTPDKTAICALLELRPDLAYVLGQLLYNRMGGIAYLVLKKQNLLKTIHREMRNTLKTVFEANVVQTASMKHTLGELSMLLSDFPAPYAVLKGAYLAGIYESGMRTSNDVDILIEQQNISQLSCRLKQNGFRQGHVENGVFREATRQEIVYSRMNRGETVPFLKRVDLPQMEYFEIDLNFSLDYQPLAKTGTVAELLQHAKQDIETPGGSLYTLQQQDFILHLCVHLYKEATTYPWVQMGRDLSLYKFCDLYLLLSDANAVALQSLEQRAAALGLLQECYYALYGTKTLFSIQNSAVDQLLSRLSENCRPINRIIHPERNKEFAYEMPLTEWFFCHDRLHYLKEVTCT